MTRKCCRTDPVLGSRFTLTTDQNGQVPLTVWAGTVPGHAFTEASETADTSVKDAVSFPLSASGERFPPLDGFAQLFYNAIRATQSSAKVQVFVHFNQQPDRSQRVRLRTFSSNG